MLTCSSACTIEINWKVNTFKAFEDPVFENIIKKIRKLNKILIFDIHYHTFHVGLKETTFLLSFFIHRKHLENDKKISSILCQQQTRERYPNNPKKKMVSIHPFKALVLFQVFTIFDMAF